MLPVLPSNPECTLCPLHEFPRNPGIGAVWLRRSCPPAPALPGVLFLGQNPGYEEDLRSEPFVGPSGRILRDAYILGSGLNTLASVYLTNAARCRTPGNTPPTRAHYKACMPYTRRDLASLATVHQILYVCTLGAPATAAFFKDLVHEKGNVSLSEAFTRAGLKYWLPDLSLSVVFFATYHPAYILRDRKHIHAVNGHLTLLADTIRGTAPLPSSPTLIPPRNPHWSPEEEPIIRT